MGILKANHRKDLVQIKSLPKYDSANYASETSRYISESRQSVFYTEYIYVYITDKTMSLRLIAFTEESAAKMI